MSRRQALATLYVSAASFKAQCLRLLDEVARQRRPIVVTNRGKPVAKLVPVDEEPIDLFGRIAARSSARSRTWNGLATPKTSEQQTLLLDTQVWLWLVAGAPQLSTEARGAIGLAVGRGVPRISAISLSEIALLASRGRIALGKPASVWLEEALAEPGPAIEALTARVAVESCELPEPFHPDPADRRDRRHGAGDRRHVDDP
jgi:prevent-host-death family protein